MPRKTSISKDALEQAAFDICRAEGAESLTARRLAQVLGCSTQPVYTACGSMEQLKSTVAERVKDFTIQRLAERAGDVPPFLQIGYASLRLAHEEPHLFRLASAHMRARLDEPPPLQILEAMRADPRLAPLSEERLVRVHSLVWVFAQGLATLLGPDAPEGALARAEALLRDAGEAIIAQKRVTANTVPGGSMPSLNHSVVRTHDFEPLTIEGRLPEGLAGTVYRAGPGLLERFGQPAGHPFLADGAITAVRIGADGPQGACQIVESAEYREEEAEGRLLYAPSAPRGRYLRNLVGGRKKATGNTNLLSWRGRLLALMEGAKPVEIDPDTLESMGTTDLAVVRDSFSAHPHRVEALKTTFNFGMRGKSIDLYALPDGAPARWLGSFDLPWISMVHDFIATEKHLVFVIGPARLVLWRAALVIGDVTQYLRWDPKAGAMIVVVPLADPQTAVKFTADAFWVWHFANAFENGAHIVVDFCWHHTCGAFAAPSSASAQHGAPQLRRLSIDPAAKTLKEETLWAAPCEFPSVNPNKTGGRHRYVWLQSLAEPPQHPGVARFDCETGEVESWGAPTAHLGSEPMFVPAGEREEAGWVLQLFQDPAAERSYLAVLDAERLADGPMAKVWFDQPIPMTFHGIFVR